MSCTHPHLAWRIWHEEDQKYAIHFLDGKGYDLKRAEAKYGKGDVLLIPCGKCLECRKAYARNWANRCVLEASSYKENWFVTLTYDDEHIGNNKLDKRDLQLFLKRLRKKLTGQKIRYFACGEYGEKTGRKHFHLILFNCELPDVKSLGKGRIDGYYYESALLSSCWDKGCSLLGDVSFSSCQYVARYCMKKLYQDSSDEFVLMSRRPGIGYNYLINNAAELMKDDVIYFYSDNKVMMYPPRYWDKLFQKLDPVLYEQVKSKRLSNQDLSVASEILRRGLKQKEDLFGVHELLGSAVIKRGL